MCYVPMWVNIVIETSVRLSMRPRFPHQTTTIYMAIRRSELRKNNNSSSLRNFICVKLSVIFKGKKHIPFKIVIYLAGMRL